MDNNIAKRIQSLRDRLVYLKDIFAGKHRDNADLLEQRLDTFSEKASADALDDPYAELAGLWTACVECAIPSEYA